MRKLTTKRKKKCFNHCKKDCQNQEAATESFIGVLNFLSKSLENTSGTLHFSTVSSHMAVALLAKGTLSQEFCKILPIDSNGNIIEQQKNKRNKNNILYCVSARKIQSTKAESFSSGVSVLSETDMIDVAKTLVIVIGRLWARCPIKKKLCVKVRN